MLALDAQAQTAGITALIGIGVFPGLTNLLAKHAAAQLEQVEELRVCIVLTIREPRQRLAAMRASGRISASGKACWRAASGSPRIYREGHWVDLEALPTGVEVEMPPGRSVTAYPIRLSEAITLPRYLPGVRTVSTLFSLLPPRADALFRAQAQRITAGEIEASQAVLSLFEALAANPTRPGTPPWGASRPHLGRGAGPQSRPPSPLCLLADGKWAPTEAILAMAALKLLRGEIRARGVVPPEAIFEPIPFFT